MWKALSACARDRMLLVQFSARFLSLAPRRFPETFRKPLDSRHRDSRLARTATESRNLLEGNILEGSSVRRVDFALCVRIGIHILVNTFAKFHFHSSYLSGARYSRALANCHEKEPWRGFQHKCRLRILSRLHKRQRYFSPEFCTAVQNIPESKPKVRTLARSLARRC